MAQSGNMEDAPRSACIIPFIMKTHGRVNETVLNYVRKLAPADPHTRPLTIHDIWQSLSATLQRTDATIIHVLHLL